MLGRGRCRLGTLLAIAAVVGCLAAPTAAQGRAGPSAPPAQGAERYQAAHLEPPEPIAATEGPTNRQSGLDAQVGSLPFTGWDLIVLAGVTLALSGTGILLQRLSVPRGTRA